MCSLEWKRRTKGISKNCQKGRLTFIDPTKTAVQYRADPGDGIIMTILKRRDLPGRMYYLTMGRWICMTRESNIHVIVKKNLCEY